MKLYLGSVESFLPHQTRIYTDVDGKLVDLNPAYAAYLTQVQGKHSSAYDLAAYYFPQTITAFLERGGQAQEALNETVAFVRAGGLDDLRGPAGEKLAYDLKEVRQLPPLQNPEKSFVIGFSDKARIEAMPKAEIPTGFYKLPQTFVTNGAPVVWPKFSEEVDADACLAIVVGKAGRRISPEKAWEHVAGVTMLIDVTARDINKREGLTTNNLLGKNFPSSTSLGPGVLLTHARKEIEALDIELSLDGGVKQKFSLSHCVFTVEQIIARFSILGVKPGDLLAIGASMTLRGDRLENPAPLRIGSTLRCSSPPIGELVHQVVSAGEAHR
jgi:2-keto-4-pentenoate hydratase/2-oxohepta-3-ene-1,7-dioic acid hydratase in catechol pathway